MSKSATTRFQENILETSKTNFSRIILALNLQNNSPAKLMQEGRRLLEQTGPYICGIRFGRQTVLNLGIERTKNLVKAAHKEDLISIIDDKLNDIDDTNAAICEAYYNLGFDGIIVNPFVGWKGGLDQVFQLSHNRGKGVITLVYMSHPGAVEGYGRLVIVNGEEPRPFYHIFAENAKTWGSDGVVVGATRPEIVTEVKTILGDDVQIFSPGIGVQGGRITPNTGSDFYIIGRSITGASNPETAAQDFARQSMNSN